MSESKSDSVPSREHIEGPFREGDEDPSKAPFELMAQFLLLINERRMAEALELSHEILRHEPNNQLVKEYQKTLRKYIRKAIEESKLADEEEEDDDDDTSDSEGSGSSDGSDTSSSDSSNNSGGAATDSEESVEEENTSQLTTNSVSRGATVQSSEPKRSALRDMYAFEKK